MYNVQYSVSSILKLLDTTFPLVCVEQCPSSVLMTSFLFIKIELSQLTDNSLRIEYCKLLFVYNVYIVMLCISSLIGQFDLIVLKSTVLNFNLLKLSLPQSINLVHQLENGPNLTKTLLYVRLF